jgi:fumarate reductase flavoprotein subunit
MSEAEAEFDLLAFGGGFAGLTAACRAAQLGLKAAVLEKEDGERYLCNSRYTSGVLVVMGRHALSPPEQLEKAILDGNGGTANPALARAVAYNAGRTVAWMRDQGVRLLEAQASEGKQLILAPPRRFVEGLDWEGRGGDVTLRTLTANLVKRGGRLILGTKAQSLLMEKGACVGLNALHNGRPVAYRARAVVIADGGFQADPEMVRRYISPRAERLLLRAAPGGRGDGIRMAEEAGALTSGYGSFYGHLHHREALSNERLWPYPHLDSIAAVSVLVGPDGKRFTDEGLGGVCMANAVARLEDPLSATVLFDDAIWNGEAGRARPVGANPYLITAGGGTLSAPELRSLAQRAGLPADAVMQTVLQYNEALGKNSVGDLDPPRTAAKFKPLPLVKPPFHAVPLCTGITGTMGGIEIDANAQALGRDGGPIPGLYVVGTPVSGLEGGPRAGYVGGLSKAFILGLIAADHIAGSAPRAQPA